MHGLNPALHVCEKREDGVVVPAINLQRDIGGNHGACVDQPLGEQNRVADR